MSKMKELLNDLFDYKNGELIRKVRTCNRVQIGESAGTRRPDGRAVVMVDGKRYFRSRLIWIFHHGDIPDNRVIDHIDTDGRKDDDRIENLRLATNSQNQYNRKAKGCDLHRGKWRASIQHQGKKIHLGLFNCETAARFAYLKAKKKLAGEFAPHVA